LAVVELVAHQEIVVDQVVEHQQILVVALPITVILTLEVVVVLVQEPLHQIVEMVVMVDQE
tara:strand:+ start:389 stop:571 length:183 start_codon:yes stop_codon:yes gene_type:complete